MKHSTLLALAGSSLLLLQACGGGSDDAVQNPKVDARVLVADAGTSHTASAVDTTVDATKVATDTSPLPGAGGVFTLQQRTSAASTVAATNPLCTGLTGFYWEIGDKNGKLASGTAGARASSAPTPRADTVLPVASASKWIFAAYIAEKQRGLLSAQDIKFLNFTSGYTNFSSCSATSTVGSCLGEPGQVGGSNGDFVPSREGRYYYNGGHMQVMANMVGLGPNVNAVLGTNIKAVEGTDLALTYAEPQLAGGARMSATTYGQFLRNHLNGRYQYMPALLGQNAVCTHTNGTDCPSALFSPLNQSKPGPVNDLSDERWHYSMGHWVEDDPTVGDGAYSSAGMLGFYPWIDKSKTYYGVVARMEVVGPNALPAGQASMRCGRQIRAAWVNPGLVQTAR